MKILFISEFYPPKILGGGEVNLQEMAQALTQDAEVSVLTSSFEDLPSYERSNEVKIYRKLRTGNSASGLWNNFQRSFIFPSSIVKEVKKLARKENFDTIHFIGTSMIAAKKLRKLNIPLVATIESYPTLCPKGDRIYHGKKECKTQCSLQKFVSCQSKCNEIGKTKNNWYLKYNPFLLLYIYRFHARMKKSLNYCRLIAISRYIQYVLKKHQHGSVCIPNIIDVKSFEPRKSGLRQVVEAIGLQNMPLINLTNKRTNQCKKKVLYLGSLTKYKGPQILLQAIQGLNVHLDIYGDGPIKEELQTIIDKNKLDAIIHQPVSYEQIPSIYANTDIVVFPSIWPEPFGRIAVEGFAAQKIVIGSDIGAIKEIMCQGGILVKPGSVQELHKALKETVAQKTPNLDYYKSNNVVNSLMQLYGKGQ
jgi:glycosyltransferase involved in cell wall biosynthesis